MITKLEIYKTLESCRRSFRVLPTREMQDMNRLTMLLRTELEKGRIKRDVGNRVSKTAQKPARSRR